MKSVTSNGYIIVAYEWNFIGASFTRNFYCFFYDRIALTKKSLQMIIREFRGQATYSESFYFG